MLLGLLDLLGRRGVDAVVVGGVDDVLAEADELAPQVEVVDRPAVVLGVDDGHRRAGEPREVLGAADVGERLVVLEVVLERDRRGDLAALDEREHRLVDAPVHRLEEVSGLQERRDAVGHLVVDEHGPEQRLLGLEVVRQGPIRDGLVPFGRYALHRQAPLIHDAARIYRPRRARGKAYRPPAAK